MTDQTELSIHASSILSGTGGEIMHDQLYDTVQTASILGLTRRTLERWRIENRGPIVTRLYAGAPPRYLGGDILVFLRACRTSDMPYPGIRGVGHE